MSKNTSSTQEEVTNKFIEEIYKKYLGIEDKRIRELEVDVTVKERMKLEKEEVRIITEKFKEKKKEQGTSLSHKKVKNNSGQTKKNFQAGGVKVGKFRYTKLPKWNDH
ncbi:hypothetical protein GLOIN_2v1787298 [Rhizophagus irregularis DAOM 181602=DAOM 197198]|uniref:Uncharacterized protein n=1 Tax=Rhizophagus irregularis (strain DAOM 181602 / DAOM 197198 / MUCL 43194) TaxID=747089 RepID=A0A2P4P661_RHIID|nr:hypothetical protein GLOIN_2v1787298 [Rhizophagus irregularis DAOM 181602=DAOM 197198]POG60876.1 hypothetical protein GLOIN_2v1787298 [Rhizophagus irregularis DAOM 181602=DAOM 197198]GBC22105.2 hypothetical protein GLOIN_2v1787298 [Rhizophagus irregularis DAOM 181602=DAOM 197198]|eukprot:XP_025167742.1 hypothetical protein GLOIN_2v1787298 [Rhizophagus irregularis DAOM 181602=DAOM 197198]